MPNKSVITLAIIILLTLGLAMVAVSFFNQIACEGQPINNNVSPTADQQIWGERTISQSFVAPKNGLNQIDVLFQTYQRSNTHQITIRLLEATGQLDSPLAGVELFKTSFSATTLVDQAWHSFTFPPITNSAGKSYLITIASPDSISGNAVTVGGIERNVYLPGSAFLGSTPVLADIAFRACFEMTYYDKAQILAEQLIRHRSAVWSYGSTYGVSLLLYSLLLAAFFWQLIKLIG